MKKKTLALLVGLSTILGSHVALAADTSKTATPAPAAVFNATQKQAIEQIVHDYLVQHPEVLVEASQALQMKQQTMMLKQAETAIPANAEALIHSSTSPVAGNAKGAVTVVEFFDYQCPHCKSMLPIIQSLIDANKDVRVVYKQMPIFGADSEFASRAALASEKQGKYDVFHAALMKSQGRLPNQTVLDIAKSVGIDTNRLEADMKQADITKEINDNGQLAEKIGIHGTPAFIIISQEGGKVEDQFIPGETTQAALQNAVNTVKAKMKK